MTMSATRRKHVASVRLLPPNLCIFQGLPDTVLLALDHSKAANHNRRLMGRLWFYLKLVSLGKAALLPSEPLPGN